SGTGGTGVSMTGGSGNSTLSSSGGTSVTMFSGSGNDSLSSSGGSGVSMVGGSGNDTLSATGGTAVAMGGLQGNNTYLSPGDASHPLSATLDDLATFGQDLPQTDGQTPGVNTIEFPGVAGGISLDLGNASSGTATTAAQVQQVTPYITLSLVGQ